MCRFCFFSTYNTYNIIVRVEFFHIHAKMQWFLKFIVLWKCSIFMHILNEKITGVVRWSKYGVNKILTWIHLCMCVCHLFACMCVWVLRLICFGGPTKTVLLNFLLLATYSILGNKKFYNNNYMMLVFTSHHNFIYYWLIFSLRRSSI